MPNVNPTRRPHLTLLGAALLLGAAGCSVLEPEKIDYKTAGRGNSLEIPPVLTQLPGQSRYTVPGGAVTASGYQAGQAVVARQVAQLHRTRGAQRREGVGNQSNPHRLNIPSTPPASRNPCSCG